MRPSHLPIFSDDRGKRWSLGSVVIATWWQRNETDDGFDVVERQEEGTVHRVSPGGDEEWLVEVTFGPALDAHPSFQPGPLAPSACFVPDA